VAHLDGIWWSEAGDSPAVVVVPRLNVDWTEMNLTALTDRFRMVTVAPQGFGPSARPGSYHGTRFVADIRRVLDHLEIGRFATFGYSMNGAMAARLAVGSTRVTAVACGGFPLTANLTDMAERARGRNAVARQDPENWTELMAAYDPEAAVAFWDDVGRLPHAALAEVECPVRAWWASGTRSCPDSCPLTNWGAPWPRVASSTTLSPGSTTPECSTGSTSSCRPSPLGSPISPVGSAAPPADNHRACQSTPPVSRLLPDASLRRLTADV